MAEGSAKSFLLLHGPNLNLLGERSKEHYGSISLKELEAKVSCYAGNRGMSLACFQSNSEGDLIDAIHNARHEHAGIIFNPGAYAHYSYALLDAVDAVSIPVVEVHLSDILNREPFRRVSVIAPACVAQICGKGVEGYYEAIEVLLNHLD